MPLTSPVYARAVSTHGIGQAIPRYDRCMMSAAILFFRFSGIKGTAIPRHFLELSTLQDPRILGTKNVPACYCAFCVEKRTKQEPADVEGKGWPSCAGERRWLGQPWPFSQTGWLQHAGLCHKESGGCPGCAGL